MTGNPSEPRSISALSGDQKRALLAKLLQQKVDRSVRFPMSLGQQGLWHSFRRNPQNTAFSVFLPSRYRSQLSIDVLKQSIQLLTRRHSCLRTTFSDKDGRLEQVVHEDQAIEFHTHELLAATDEQIRQRLQADMKVPFDLEKGPLTRVICYQIADDDWVVLAMTHHIIVDFWSLVLILAELRHIYAALAGGLLPKLPEPIDNFRQFVEYQSQMLAGPQGQRLNNFWREYIQGVPPYLELPLDKPRPPIFTNQADCVPIEISQQTLVSASALAGNCNATLFSVVLSAVQVLLSRYSRQSDFFVGSPFSGRLHQSFESTVGFFINMLPIKATLGQPMTFSQLIRQTSGRLVDVLEHEALPIAEIVRQSNLFRDPSRSPLFQVSCTFERAQRAEERGRASFLFPDQRTVFKFAGLHQESFYVPHPTCHYDLEFVFEHAEHKMQAMLLFCRDLFSVESMTQLTRNFSSLLDSLLHWADLPISEVPWNLQDSHAVPNIQPPADLLNNEDTSARNVNTVHDLIQASCARFTDAVAIDAAGHAITYQQLIRSADLLKQKLTEAGVVPDDLIPVYCRSGYNAFLAMFAIQLAGGAPVPVDASQASISIQQLMDQIKPRAVLSDEVELLASANLLSDSRAPILDCDLLKLYQRTDNNAETYRGTNCDSFLSETTAKAEPSNLAYMIYTSGSTGTPKGVMVEHDSICNTLHWRSRALSLQPGDRVLMLLSHQFDASLGIAWSCLVQGATIVWPDTRSRNDPEKLLDFLQREQITVLPAVPSLLRVLVGSPKFAACHALRMIWTGGEAVPADLPALVREKSQARFWNLYGPTEAAVEATAIEITNHQPDAQMTIGFPIDGIEVFALDEHLRPVPSTVPGELVIAGRGLARGYFGDNNLTEAKFITDPRNPARRVYRTGDLGRLLTDGRVEFLGRDDHQVKLRGYRIELGEIEVVLDSFPGIERAAVIVDDPGSPAAKLIAYVSGLEDTQARHEAVRNYLTSKLAHYKIPAAIVVLEQLPQTSSGKVDRKRLPKQVPEASWLQRVVPPRNELERFLVDAWCAELKVSTVGIHQNLFELGGTSLQAALLTSQLSRQLGIHVPTTLLFDLADIAQLAKRLVQLHPQLMESRFGSDINQTYLDASNATSPVDHPLLAGLKPTGSQLPIFMIHPPGGIVLCYRDLAANLPESRPLWAIRSRGLHGAETLPQTLEQMASDYIQAIHAVQPVGPYIIGGWSLGGLIAYEVAKQLLQMGEQVDRLVFLDTTIPEGAADCVPKSEQVNVGLEYGIELTLEQLGQLSPEQQLPLLHQHADKLGILNDQSPPEVVAKVLSDLQNLFHHHVSLSRCYKLEPLDIRVLLLRPLEVPFELTVSEDRGWRHLVREVQVCFVPGHHHSMVQQPHAKHLADAISRAI